MDDIFVKLYGLRAGVAQDIKVCGYNYHEYPLGLGGIYSEDLDCPSIKWAGAHLSGLNKLFFGYSILGESVLGPVLPRP